MDIPRGSHQSEKDRYTFFKVQILFFLLAATDGHAKNFSIFLLPGGRYQLTPVYDVHSPVEISTRILQGMIKAVERLPR